MADNTTTNKKRTADGNALSGDDMGSKATSAVPNNRVPQQNSDVNTHSMENMKKLALPKDRPKSPPTHPAPPHRKGGGSVMGEPFAGSPIA